MKIYIEKVEPGAVYEDYIYDFWITAKLSTGLKIKIFDHETFDLRNFALKEVECLIVAAFIEKVNTLYDIRGPIISGRYFPKYVLTGGWNKIASSFYRSMFDFVETKDGIILIYPSDAKEWNFQEGEDINFSVTRFDLIGVNI